MAYYANSMVNKYGNHGIISVHETLLYPLYIDIYAFCRRFYPKWLAMHFKVHLHS